MDILKNRVIHENDAVMFDIDDTLIFLNGTLNTPIVKLLHYSKSLGYKIIIITARPILKPVINFTVNQLKRHGIPYGIQFHTIGW
jgi:hydroxymethylpyrimidine pyrophosphatase-like HAD family hydrolase